MKMRLHPLYKKLLLLSMVLGPIVWLVLTEDGQQRTDLVLLHLLGKPELNLAIENLHGEMSETQFRDLFPDLELGCGAGASPFGDRLCNAEVGAFSGIPSRAITLFLSTERLRAAKVVYRRAYHETLRRDLERRLGAAVQEPAAEARGAGPLSWPVSDGVLLLASEQPASDKEAALLWLSAAAVQRQKEEVGVRY